MKINARAYRQKMKKGAMNNTEKAYSEHLAKLKLAGEIIDYAYEPETLKLGPDCRYTPDFRVLKRSISLLNDELNEGSEYIEFHEVKGSRKIKTESGHTLVKAFVEDDALVKIKTCATIHPMYKYIIVWKGQDGSWLKKEIN